MINNDHLKELSDRLSRLLPAAEKLRADTRSKIEETLRQSLANMGMLTKEEFESQARALRRAEARIAELEKKLSELEANPESADPAASADSAK